MGNWFFTHYPSRQDQIIWLVAQGKKMEEVEEITGYSRTSGQRP